MFSINYFRKKKKREKGSDLKRSTTLRSTPGTPPSNPLSSRSPEDVDEHEVERGEFRGRSEVEHVHDKYIQYVLLVPDTVSITA